MAQEPAVRIGVLLGAGPRLSGSTRSKLRVLMKEVFAFAQPLVRGINTDLDLAAFAVSLTQMLENSELTNAGKGSEMTIDGLVECDASMVLCGQNGDVAASCGAIPGVLNPISLCYELVKQQLEGTDRTRAAPNFLAGSAACDYAMRLGLPTGTLTTARAEETRQKYLLLGSDQPIDRYLDTVGLIVVRGNTICACSSSGGPILKDAGRVGPAALIGCGVYAASGSASVCSGFGEDITATRLACAVVESAGDLAKLLSGPWRQKLQRSPYFGVVKATATSEGAAFEWQHTTEGMVCGFACVTGASISPHFITSTEPQGGGINI